jgi:hypothetical protein
VSTLCYGNLRVFVPEWKELFRNQPERIKEIATMFDNDPNPIDKNSSIYQ